MKKNLSFFNKICYGFGSMGYSSLSQTLNSFIMFFATSVMGLSGSLVGIAIAISSLWDGVSDPLMGNISDRTRNKFFGKRMGYILFAVFAVSVCNILLWSMPKSSQTIMFLWLLIFMLLQETCNTFFSTPNSALAIDLAPDYNDQSKIQSYKTIFNIVGMILPSILMYVFLPSSSLGVQTEYTQTGFLSIALVNSALMIICGLVGVFGNLRYVQKYCCYESNEEKISFKKLIFGYFHIFAKSSFSCVILGYAMSQMASSILTSIGIHLFTFCYGFSAGQISILLFVLFGGAVISQPSWVKLSEKTDKKSSIITGLSVVLIGIGLVLTTFLFRAYLSKDVIFTFVCISVLVIGFGTGAMYSLPISMYADSVMMEQYETGVNNAGSYLGYYSFTYNLSSSLSMLLVGFMLDLIKFDPGANIQTLAVQNGLGIIVFCGCSIAITCSILIFSRYKLKRSEILKVQLKLKGK